ncbi:TerB family tellurite resistance protein [Desulfoluna sp.]|uniref:TerB family tellurite resistance protein n=1 Tax=Desulfoluna sp. TaxID=2045199 RepID=UPI002616580C|nr:TerB family tellurite resistance protein [Desulfoluna sp.]
MNFLLRRDERHSYKARGTFYCPGCRQTVACLVVTTVTVTRLLWIPVYRRALNSGLVKCPLCGGVFGREVTAFSPSVSRDGLKPALVAVLMLMMEADESRLEMSVVSRIVAEVTGQEVCSESIHAEIQQLLAEKDALGDRLRAIVPYLTNAEKRLILESAFRVAHADGQASEKKMALMDQVASLLRVPDSIYKRVVGSGGEEDTHSILSAS